MHNYVDFTQKICQKLPFSNILLLSTDEDFFDMGNKIFNELLENGIKIKTVIIKANNHSQLDELLKEKNIFLEFRAVVIFNKQILNYIKLNGNIFPKIFYLQLESDIYGIFNTEQKNLVVEYFFYVPKIDKTIVLKNFLIRTLALIDYCFYNVLTQKAIDKAFFIRVKRYLVCAITTHKSEKDLDELFNILVLLEKMFALKPEINFCSANVACYLMQKSYYDLELNYFASKKIIKCYSQMLLNKYSSDLNFSERAKLVSFFSKEDINICLKSLSRQLKQINDSAYQIDKQEIKSLFKIYTKLYHEIKNINQINTKKNKKSRLYNHKLDMCISVCGDTKFSINGMTLARQMSF